MSYSLYLALSLRPVTFLALMSTWGVLAIVLGVVAAVLVALYFYGKRLQKKQDDAQAQIDAQKQTVSILVIDKKKLRPKESGLPEMALSQIPWYAKRAKLPIVKAKIGPQIMSLVADQGVFDVIPVKKECKVSLSGIYITEIKSVRGGKIPDPPKKKKLWERILRRDDAAKKTASNKKK